MSDRTTALSAAGVVLSFVGSTAQSLLLSVAGPLLTLLVHFYTERAARQAARDHCESCDNLRSIVWQLNNRLDRLERRRLVPDTAPDRQAGGPVPFLPGEAATDA